MKFIWTGFVAGVCLLISASALAQDEYPRAKPITIIVPFAAGSGTDVLARALVIGMAKELKGANFLIDNRPGANGIIGAGLAAKAVPDGYTLFLTTMTTHSVNPHIYKKLPYNPNTDFDAVGMVGETAPVLLTPASNPARSLKDVVELARKEPGRLTFGTSNTSSLAATQLFEKLAGAKVVSVSYKATPQIFTDMLGGSIDYFFGDPTSSAAHVRSGTLRALATLSDHRVPGFPNLPTTAEAGYPGMTISIWIGMFSPRGTPNARLESLNRALVRSLHQAAMKQMLSDAAINMKTGTTAEFAAYVAAQYVRWGKLASDLNLQTE